MATTSGARALHRRSPFADGWPAGAFEFTSLTVDEDRHLRLVVYARQQEALEPPE
ncbi:Putative DNA-binding protein [Cronobacter dublinensis 582]|nr:Putative DNA-binding protein [Cronobacter dublinensis 582]